MDDIVDIFEQQKGELMEQPIVLDCPFDDVPEDILVLIFNLLPLQVLAKCRCTCKKWRELVFHPRVRIHLDITTTSLASLVKRNLEKDLWFANLYSVSLISMF